MTTAYQETRTQLVRRVAMAALAARELNVMAFSDEFVAKAFAMAPDAVNADTGMRQPHLTDGVQHEKDRAHNRQIVERWIRGVVVKFPAELEEPWVLALPERYRHQALRELAARYGLLAAPASDPSHALATFGETTQRFGKFIAAMSPIVADGVIDEKDRPYLKEALEMIASVQADLASLGQQMAKALPDEPSRSPAQLKAV
jgi:hypothetical protein